MQVQVLFDAHIHLGQFYNLYTSPLELRSFLDSIGVVCFAASSTSICEGNYDKVINEIRELNRLCGDRYFPVLWIVPQMLEDGGLDMFMDSCIRWCCLKIHPQLHPTAWVKDSPALKWVVSLASVMQVPLLIHTGEKEGCYPTLYEQAFRDYPNVTFILAHGRPIQETINMMKTYPNVWTDTAFMPTENIKRLCDEKLSERVLWGTDYPIPRYYFPDKNMKAYYLELVYKLKVAVGLDDFENIIHHNYVRLFG